MSLASERAVTAEGFHLLPCSSSFCRGDGVGLYEVQPSDKGKEAGEEMMFCIITYCHHHK